MIKHRRLSKKAAAAVLASAILIGTSTTAFAYVDPGAEQMTADRKLLLTKEHRREILYWKRRMRQEPPFLPRALHRFRMISRRILQRNF